MNKSRRRNELAALALRERNFWRSAWVWGVSPDGLKTTIASPGQRRRVYLAELPTPVSLSIRSRPLRALLERRFKKKFNQLRQDAAVLRNAVPLAAVLKEGTRTIGEWWKFTSAMHELVVMVIWGPGMRPRIRLTIATHRGWRDRGRPRFHRILNR
ncbi:MAG: hypothetical protein WDO69_08575 [Pseudomonadota bacterium]